MHKMESNTNECTMVHVQSPYVSQIFYCVDLGAASRSSVLDSICFVPPRNKNGCFTIYITFTSYSSSFQAYTFQMRYPFFALNKAGGGGGASNKK